MKISKEVSPNTTNIREEKVVVRRHQHHRVNPNPVQTRVDLQQVEEELPHLPVWPKHEPMLERHAVGEDELSRQDELGARGSSHPTGSINPRAEHF